MNASILKVINFLNYIYDFASCLSKRRFWCALSNVDVHIRGVGRPNWMHVDRGGQKASFCVDVIIGWPLTLLLYN